jgi:hypothetical protein
MAFLPPCQQTNKPPSESLGRRSQPDKQNTFSTLKRVRFRSQTVRELQGWTLFVSQVTSLSRKRRVTSLGWVHGTTIQQV